MRGGFGKKTGLLIGGAAAAVAVAALLAVVVSGLFSSPRERLERAVVKSFAAWAEAADALDLPDPGKLKRSVSQRMSLRLNSLDTAVIGYDLPALEGIDLRLRSDLDGRELGAELAAFRDGRELLSVLLAVDDAEACLASPQLTGGEFYGVNTETLGEDLKRLGLRDTADISFNFFDLLDIAAPERQAEERTREANMALYEAVQVEKGGKETIFVNQAEIKTDVYQVTIPQEAVRDYGNAYADLAEPLEDLPDELSDVKLTVHVGGGYVSAVKYEGYLFDDDTFLKLDLYLGGGEEYVDDLRLEVDVDGRKVIIDSSGDHSGRDGVFTDKTTIQWGFFVVSSELRYGPGENLSWTVSVPGAGSLEMAGLLTFGEESIDLHLDELTLKVLGMELCSAEMDYFAGPCEGRSVTARDPRLIGEMNGLELMAAALKLQVNVQTWMKDMQGIFNF